MSSTTEQDDATKMGDVDLLDTFLFCIDSTSPSDRYYTEILRRMKQADTEAMVARVLEAMDRSSGYNGHTYASPINMMNLRIAAANAIRGTVS